MNIETVSFATYGAQGLTMRAPRDRRLPLSRRGRRLLMVAVVLSCALALAMVALVMRVSQPASQTGAQAVRPVPPTPPTGPSRTGTSLPLLPQLRRDIGSATTSTLAGGYFEPINTFIARGAVVSQIVGPGPTAGSQWLYVSYTYAGATLEVVGLDPLTGQTKIFKCPVKSEDAAWASAAGPDGRIYFGTAPGGHILRLDPKTGSFVDLGRPSSTETYIWRLTNATDGKIYGCTYPSAKLIRIDPATGALQDLGRMQADEQYARFGGGGKNGFVYVGVGMRQARLIAYEIATGQHRDILPASLRGQSVVQTYRCQDGNAYAVAAGQAFRLEGWNAISVPTWQVPAAEGWETLKDGRTVAAEGTTFKVTNHKTGAVTTWPYGYKGCPLAIFRLAKGWDGLLYASTILPIHLISLNTTTRQIRDIGLLGTGEVYSLLGTSWGILMAAYNGQAPLMAYRPLEPFKPGAPPAGNPTMVKFTGYDTAWRPEAMVAGPGDKVYIGGVPGYGKVGGPLVVWNPATNAVQRFDVFGQQAVASLAVSNGLVIGGTTIQGGGGSKVTETTAKLFIWDAQAQKKIYEVSMANGLGDVTDLVAAPGGTVYGIAGGKTLFAFDPLRRTMLRSTPLPFGGVLHNCIGVGADGKLWGLAASGVFSITPATGQVSLVAKSPQPITRGFVINGRDIYFASGPTIYHFRIP